MTPEALAAIQDCLGEYWVTCTEGPLGWNPGYQIFGNLSCDPNATPTDIVHCGSGLPCAQGLECNSGICDAQGLCAPAACADALTNGTETDLSCGGRCGGCFDGQACNEPLDCASLYCVNAQCVPASCANGLNDPGETDVDCGGPDCAPCLDGGQCISNDDCAQSSCVNGQCGAATCSDFFRNQDESDVDCGGSMCLPCPSTMLCETNRDCISGNCVDDNGQLRCASATCSDGIRNANELGIDCGGSCSPCPAGGECTGSCLAPSTCMDDVCVPTDPAVDAPLRTGPSPSVELDWRFFLEAGYQAGADLTELPEGKLGIVHGRVVTRRVLATDPVVPVAGVKIRALGHPGFGQTATRADGRFEFIVRGAATRYTLEISHPDYIGVQRHFKVGWEDETWLDDVALTQLSLFATTIVMNAPDPQWAIGDTTLPEALELVPGEPMLRAERTAAILVPPGMMAVAVLPDGADPDTDPDRANLADFNVRLTEFTVGPDGMAAMPAPLPSYSGYNYAADFRVDESETLGAIRTEFVSAADPNIPLPVISYVENFRGLDVGAEVPLGVYDRICGAWCEEESGQIIEIVDIDANGRAVIGYNGAVPAQVLPDWELLKLAEQYDVGTQLWRVPMRHFSQPDLNWRVECNSLVADCTAPNNGQIEPRRAEDCYSAQPASVIECENQVLGKSLPLAATPFTLEYRSSRVPGFQQMSELPVRLTGATVPDGLKAIDFRFEVLGSDIKGGSYHTLLTPNMFDSIDAATVDGMGRELMGGTTVRVSIGYVYPGISRPGSFASTDDGVLVSGATGNDWIEWDTQFVPWPRQDARSHHMGGWTLSALHTYDVLARTLFLGSGDRRYGSELEQATRNVAGEGVPGGGYLPVTSSIPPQGPAQGQAIGYPLGMVFDSYGNLYFTDIRTNGVESRVLKVNTAGDLETVHGFTGNETPAGIAIDPDGNLVWSDWHRHCVVRLINGELEVVVGQCGVNGVNGDWLDGVSATDAKLFHPGGIAFAPDGSLVVANTSCLSTRGAFECPPVANVAQVARVLRVLPCGTVYTVAGGGAGGPDYGNGGRARDAQFGYTSGVAVDDQGVIYASDRSHGQVRRISPDGWITRFAGRSESQPACTPAEIETLGIAAAEVCLDSPMGVTATHGEVYIADSENHRILQVGRDGTAHLVMGASEPVTRAAGEFAEVTGLHAPSSAVVGPDGALYVAATFSSWIARIANPLPGSKSEIRVPSSDGTMEYVFDRGGRHLATDSAFNGLRLLDFGYTADTLTSVTDAHGNVTQFNYDVNGNLDSVQAPHGQVTDVVVDNDGWLDTLILPGGRTFDIGHDPGGLLLTVVDPRGGNHSYAYTPEGKLDNTTGPDGATRGLLREELPVASPDLQHWKVTHTTQLSRKTEYTVNRERTTVTRQTKFPDGSRVQTVREGSVTTKTIPYGETQLSDAQMPPPQSATVQAQAHPHWKNGAATPVQSVTSTSIGGQVSVVEVEKTEVEPVAPALGGEQTVVTINGIPWTTLHELLPTGSELRTTSPEGRQTLHTLDEFGRVVRSEIPGSSLLPVERGFFPDGKLKWVRVGEQADPQARQTTFAYVPTGVAAGRIQQVTDPAGRVATFVYDPVTGDLTEQHLPGGRDVVFGRSGAGDLRSLDPPGLSGKHGFSSDEMGRRTSYAVPALTTPTACVDDADCTAPEICVASACAAPERRTDTTFDQDRKVKQSIAQAGTTVTPAYDPSSGRIDSVDVSGEGVTTVMYDDDGRPWRWESPNGEVLEVLVEWPALPATEFRTVTRRWLDPGAQLRGAVIQGFDAQGRLIREAVQDDQGDPIGSVVTYSYSDDGAIESMQLDADPQQTVTYVRDPITGALESATIGDLTTTYAYNPFGELASVLTTDANNAIVYGYILDEPGFERDSLGRITQRTEIKEGLPTVYSYRYDAAGRLEEVDVDGVLRWKYGYDDNGNRTYFKDVVEGVELFPSDFEYDERDRLERQGDLQFEYDGNDRLTLQIDAITGNRTYFEYNTAGGLVSAREETTPPLPLTPTELWRVEYVLDPFGRRIGRQEFTAGVPTDETWWLYRNALKPAITLTGNGDFEQSIHATGLSPDFQNQSGVLVNLAGDHLGSTTGTIDPTTPAYNPVATYSPFGKRTTLAPSWTGYAAGLPDPLTGLVRFGARDYNPKTARWNAPDPIRFDAGSTNLTTYCRSDPVNHIDPSGLVDFVDSPGAGDLLKGWLYLLEGIPQLPDWWAEGSLDPERGSPLQSPVPKKGTYVCSDEMLNMGPFLSAFGQRHFFLLADGESRGIDENESGDAVWDADYNKIGRTTYPTARCWAEPSVSPECVQEQFKTDPGKYVLFRNDCEDIVDDVLRKCR